MAIHSYRPNEAALSDAQFGQMPQEVQMPLVNLAVEKVPQANQADNAIVAGMVLAGMNGEKGASETVGADFVQLAARRRNFEDALKTEFPEKYKMLKDNAKNLRLELCLPQDASLEQIAERLYKLRKGEISRYICRQA